MSSIFDIYSFGIVSHRLTTYNQCQVHNFKLANVILHVDLSSWVCVFVKSYITWCVNVIGAKIEDTNNTIYYGNSMIFQKMISDWKINCSYQNSSRILTSPDPSSTTHWPGDTNNKARLIARRLIIFSCILKAPMLLYYSYNKVLNCCHHLEDYPELTNSDNIGLDFQPRVYDNSVW